MTLSVEERAAQIMEHLCSHSAHGYSQPNRQGVGTGGGRGETVTLSDGSTVSISVGDRDCSSASIECYAAQGVDCGGATYTGNMRRCMVASGNFETLPASTWRSPERGDLLLTERNGHVAMALGGGKLGEFLRSENHTIHGAVGDQDGGESVIRGLYDDGWDCVLRYVGPEPEDEPVVEEVDGAVYRLLNPSTGHHIWTSSHDEAESLARSGWGYEGVAFSCVPSGGTPVYRMVVPGSDMHLFTPDLHEVGSLVVGGWGYETLGWIAPDDGDDVRRLCDPSRGEHVWTTDANEAETLVGLGWTDEGVAFKG